MTRKLSDYYFDLPKELIAQSPAPDRSSSRLLVYDKYDKSIKDEHFYDIVKYLRKGDCLVRNNTKVIPARLYGMREDTGGTMEFLLLKRLDAHTFEALVRPAKRAKKGIIYKVSDELNIEIIDTTEADGGRILRLYYDGILEEILDRVGNMPLPPYITKPLEDKNRYQTVYAKIDGSAAAPTAGMHFTQELLKQIEDMGVIIVDVLLHVGLGTFRPVSVENIDEHKMHSEYYAVSQEAADKINAARQAGGRIIAVGTTSVRTLESVADEQGVIHPKSGETNIFITPGYKFKAVDMLITNFHLPESTLLMLVSAFSSREEILRVYEHAIKERYRFFSFGDAMLILSSKQEGRLKEE
ncbi:MAG TPA: tRNA preQ1(34) S-adenosylmethionine ribosyltransferase-isomerase QueA [Clostridiales bacterium]|jgi:S-adenosylmethionine:tRNA ribosyltransferase-isomerase|nr:tRNA preQ1(34) S-adenosylmethionine ribosyltransferase-isomerase QueA [Clostridiales bacterium]